MSTSSNVGSGRSPAAGPPRAHRIVRRLREGPLSPAATEVVAVAAVLAVALLAMGVLAWYVSDPTVFLWALLTIGLFAAALGWPLLLLRRHQLVFDAEGIHVRGLLRTRHFPWPASRDRIAVLTRPRRYDYVAHAVLLDASGRRSALLGLSGYGPNQVTARGAVDAELDQLWARARAYGWVERTD